jgi:hypothetical protein
VITQFVPVAIPTFSAVYAPGVPVQVAPAVTATAPVKVVQGTAKPATATADQQLLLLLQKFDQRMTTIEQRLGIAPPATGQQGAPTMPPADAQGRAKPGDLLSAMTALAVKKCASCHSDSKAEASLALVRGGQLIDPVSLTPNQRTGMLLRTYSNDPKVQMPPPGKGIEPLTDQEYGLLVAWLSGKK